MREAIIEIIKGLIWVLIGYWGNEFLKKQTDKRSKRRLKNRLDGISNKLEESDDIFVIESGDPWFTFEDIQVRDSHKQLIISIPKEYHKQLQDHDPTWEFREQVSFDGSKDFDDLAELTKIDNIKELIQLHSTIVVQHFIDLQNKGQTIFNGGTVGLYRIGRGREGQAEKSKFTIHTYRSDFFTLRVFSSIYQSLRKAGHRIAKIKKLEEFTGLNYNYSPFLGGLAATTFVVLYNGLSIVLAERSEYITASQKKWHYTMDEGFTQTDYDDGQPSFIKCFYRGLKEELNIYDNQSLPRLPKLMDLVFHRNVFELEFTSLFFFPGSFEDFKLNYNLAKDRHLETYGVTELKLGKESIASFIRENEITGGCKLSLQLLAQRFANNEMEIYG